MLKITFSEKSNELMFSFGGFKTTVIIDPKIFSSCDLYIDRIQKFNLEKLSTDELAEINKLLYELRDSLNVNQTRANLKLLQKALSEIHAAMLILKVGIPYVSGDSSGVAVEEAANC